MDVFKYNLAEDIFYAPPIDPSPGVQIDYKINRASLLDGDTLTAVTWSASAVGITVSASSFTASTATVRLANATAGGAWIITARYTTGNG